MMTNTPDTNELALIAFLGDWVRDAALQTWVLNERTPWSEVLKLLRGRYRMNDLDIGILSKAESDPARPLLVGRATQLLKEVNMDSPPSWNGAGPSAFQPPRSSEKDSMATGWPGGTVVCLESASIAGQPRQAGPVRLSVGVAATIDFVGWNLVGPQTLSVSLGTSGATSSVHVTFVQDACGRSEGSASVTLDTAGMWDINLGTDIKCGLLQILEVT